MKPRVDIIIPSWNNREFLEPCLASVRLYQATKNLFRILVVNNGHPAACDWIAADPGLEVIQAGANLGWEGGLKLGLSHSDSEFVCFLNDDTHIPPSSRRWVNGLLQHFSDSKVGAVGPSSNIVARLQNIFTPIAPDVFQVPYLIGFCMMLRRSALDQVGGIDDSLPGGDDLDLSMRLRQAGYKLLVDRRVFVYHHGYKSGIRLRGEPTTPHGWNSYEMWSELSQALIRKHGLRVWWECLIGQLGEPNRADTLRREAIEAGLTGGVKP
ncbi:MAG: glycosyltransferase [Anaerolineae bacterium]|nr:glycosyltransferase [Anaerolineae bacterium]